MSNYHSNILLETQSKRRLLIDCGADIRYSLKELNYDYNDIDDIYVSQIGISTSRGLEWIGLMRRFTSKHKSPTLHISDQLEKPLWDHYLSGAMQTIAYECATLESFFTLNPIHVSSQFQWENYTFDLIESRANGNLSYGLFFTIGEKSLLFSLGVLSREISEKADLIFQNGEVTGLEKIPTEIRKKVWLYGIDSTPAFSGFQGVVTKGMEFTLS